LTVELLGGFSLGQHCRRACVASERPIRAGGVRDLSELVERTGGAVRVAAPYGGLDQLKQVSDPQPQASPVLGGLLGRGERLLVATQTVVAKHTAVLLGDEPEPLLVAQHVLLARCD